MSQPKAGSVLVQAVRAFDEELERFSRVAASACRRSLDSKRELERAAASLDEAARAEVSIQARAQELVAALKAAQGEQEARAEALRVRAREIEARLNEYGKLAERYRQLGEDGAPLVEVARKLKLDSRGDQPLSGRAELVEGLADLERRVSELRATARTLSVDAEEGRFEDIASEARTVEKTLSALRNQLLLAQKAAATPTPGDA